MDPAPGFSPRKIIRLSIGFYLLVLLAESGAKVLAIREQYSADAVQSSLAPMIGQALRLFGGDAVRYVITLILIYALLGWMNGRYVSLAAQELVRRRPGLERNGPALAFLAIHGAFLTLVYALNAALYPYSGLAILKGWLAAPSHVSVLRAVSIGLMGLFLAGFMIMGVRSRQKAATAVAFTVWAMILLAFLDPVFHVRQMFTRGKATLNTGPNVILIGLECLNPLHTGYFGYPLPLTPHLDTFLRENVVFQDSYTPIARTFPAWYAILTGQYPVTNGVRFNLQKRASIRSAGQCLGHALKERGYRTLHFTDEVRFSNITAADGFDVLRHPVMGVKDFLFGSIHDFSLTNVFFNSPLGGLIFPFLRLNRAVAHLYSGRYFLNDLVATIDGLKSGGPFFLVAHLCVGHWPYYHASPRRFEFRPGAEPGMAIYDSAQTIADDQLGRILDELRDAGLYEKSLIVVLSDHGESAGGHGSDLREAGENRTLLAFKPPGPSTHREVGQLVRTIDIAPTVLDLLGFATNGRKFDGLSLKPWILGTDGPATPSPDAAILETEFSLQTPGGIGLALQDLVDQGVKFYEFDKTGLITMRDDYFDLLVRRRNRAVETPRWKLIRDVLVRRDGETVQTSLFDLAADPACLRNVAADEPAVFKALTETLFRYYGGEVAAEPSAGPSVPSPYAWERPRAIMAPRVR